MNKVTLTAQCDCVSHRDGSCKNSCGLGWRGSLFRIAAWVAMGLGCAAPLIAGAAMVASDNFNRPDGPLGSNWSTPIGSQGNLVISNNQATAGTENAHCFGYWSADSFNDDQYSQATVTKIGPFTGVTVRTDSSQDRFYFAFVFGPNDYRIYARWDGTFFSLATGSSETWQVGDVLSLEVSGSASPVTVTMYRNGNPVLIWLSSSDLQVKTGGSPGMAIFSPSGQGLTLDDWQGGNLDPDVQAPTSPVNLLAATSGQTAMSLSWGPATDDVGVAGYLVERCSGSNCVDFTWIGSTAGTNFTDTGLTPATTYSYRVRATDAAGNLSPYSTVASGTTEIPQPPTISAMADQTTVMGIAVGPFPFMVSDPPYDPGTLTVTVTSSNPTLVPNGNLGLFNGGSTRSLTVIPADGQTGTATITVNVSNGVNSTSNSFLLTVNPPGNGTEIFSNSGNISIPPGGVATPYPSTIDVSGIVGTISNVIVTVHGMSHTYPSDVDMLLVGPGGQAAVLMSYTIGSYSMTNITFSLSDSAFYPLPQNSPMAPGTFRPTDYSANHTSPPHIFPASAPAAPYTTNLATFIGTSPNGTWSLYVYDSGAGDAGNIIAGWSMAIRTVSPPTISVIGNQSTVVNTASGAIGFQVNDAETPASNLVVTATSSVQSLIPDGNIVIGGSGANRTITLTPATDQLGSALITVVVTDGDGMTATNQFTFAVNPAPLTVTVDNQFQTYGGVSPPLTGSISGLQAGDNITLSLSTSATAASPVGIYNIVPTLNDPGNRLVNYTVTYVNGSLTVSPAGLSVTANDAGKVYDGLAYGGGNGVSYSGFVNNESSAVLSGTISYSGTSQGAVNVGSYNISAGGLSSGNYTITYYNGTLTVSPAGLSVSANNAVKAYDGQPFSGGNGVSYSGFVAGDGPGVVSGSPVYGGAAQGAVNAGSYALSVSGLSSGNYTLSYHAGTLTVSPAGLGVTANDASRGYGHTNPVFSASYSGFVNSEGTGVLSGALTLTTLADTNSPVGTYAIVAGGLSASNYTLSFTDGTLTVTPYALTVTAKDASKVYGQADPAFGVNYSGFVNGQDASVLGGSLSLSRAAGEAVGNYAITPSGLTSSNYSISYVNGTLSITPANLTVTANDAGKVYDGLAYSGGNGVSYSGFVNGDGPGSLSGSVSYSGTSQGAINAGSYSITPGGLSSANYSISFVNGTLSVTPAALTVSADDQMRIYGQTNPVLTVSYSGFVNGEGTNVLTSLPTASTTATTISPPGNYAITVSGGGANNYQLTFVPGTLTIVAPANVTLSSIVRVGSNILIRGTGDANVVYTINASSDLVHWQNIGSTASGVDGTFEFEDLGGADLGSRFYRTSLP